MILYSTLLAKLIEGADHLIGINMHIEQRTYEVALRNPEGVKILTKLPSSIIAKGFDGLVDAERVQVRLFTVFRGLVLAKTKDIKCIGPRRKSRVLVFIG